MKYADIIERLEKAEGPDRKIDIAIGKLLPPERIESDGSWHEENDMVRFPVVTASIDASLALVERMLPGAELEMTNLYGVARVTLHDVECSFHGEDHCNNFPIAILLSLFKALEAKERGE